MNKKDLNRKIDEYISSKTFELEQQVKKLQSENERLLNESRLSKIKKPYFTPKFESVFCEQITNIDEMMGQKLDCDVIDRNGDLVIPKARRVTRGMINALKAKLLP